MKQYHDLIKHVLENGTRKENRTGVDTLSTFGYYYEHDLRDGFPLLTTKKIDFKNIVIELLWFLSGSNKAEFLERHKCRFWLPWTDDQGVVSNCYGPAWTQFGAPDAPNNQIRWVIDELNRNPMSRRMVVNAWEPAIAQVAKLPPCHAMFVLNVQNEHVDLEARAVYPYTKQRLCLHLSQRSADIALGIPYNLASYALLLSLFSRFSGIEPGIFGHSLIDAHIYTSKADGSMSEYDHVPGLKEQLKREPKSLPKLVISDKIKTLEDVEALLDPSVSTEEIMSLFVLEGYDPHPEIKFRVAV
jgi:thymidylate synthase